MVVLTGLAGLIGFWFLSRVGLTGLVIFKSSGFSCVVCFTGMVEFTDIVLFKVTLVLGRSGFTILAVFTSRILFTGIVGFTIVMVAGSFNM